MITSVRSMMDMTIFGQIFIAAACCGFVALFVYNFKRRHLYWAAAQLEGPRAFPIIGNVSVSFGNTADITTKIMDTFNPHTLVCGRIWLGRTLYITVSDAEQVKTVLTSRKALDKADIYNFTSALVGSGLITAPASKWCRTRKLIMPAFNSKIIKLFVEVFSKQSKILTTRMRKELDCGEFNLLNYLWPCSLDIICETVMGKSFESQTDKHCRYYHATDGILEIIFLRMMKAWLYPDFIFNRTKLGRDHAEYRNYMHTVSREIIQNKKIELRMNNEGSKFLDRLMVQTDNGTKLTDDELRQEIDTIILAATDTTATTELFIMFILANHPEVQDKVFQELCEIYGDEVCSERPVVYEDLNRMEYMERVIKETMRLFPSAPLIARNIDEDLDLGKITLPKGSAALIGILTIHRSEKYWSDPLKFDPDRFLPEEVAKRHPYSFIPFSGGPRICIGQTYAITAIKIVIATVLRRYVLKKDKIISIKDVKLKINFVLKPQQDLTISISERRYPEKLGKKSNDDDEDVHDHFTK